MTWKQFKETVESDGVTDDMCITWINADFRFAGADGLKVSHFDCNYGRCFTVATVFDERPQIPYK